MGDDVFPRKGSSGSGQSPAYSVEARTSDGRPTTVNGQQFYGEWRTVRFEKFPIGVPVGVGQEASRHGLVSWASAQALRWWFHAESPVATCLQTRIVKHLINHSYTEELVGAFDTVDSLSALVGERSALDKQDE